MRWGLNFEGSRLTWAHVHRGSVIRSLPCSSFVEFAVCHVRCPYPSMRRGNFTWAAGRVSVWAGGDGVLTTVGHRVAGGWKIGVRC